jgi:hypothetical protein
MRTHTVRVPWRNALLRIAELGESLRAKRGAGVILAAWVALTLLQHAYHERWRDEGQAWLIARDSPTPAALVHALGYEGSPGVWHFILYPFAHAGSPYWVMSAVHSAIAFLAVALLVFASPFSMAENAMLVFGYFLLYRYNIVARSYVLSTLFLFLIAATYSSRRERPGLHALLLGLLANTNIHSGIISVAFAALFLWETLTARPMERLRAASFGIIYAIGLGVALYQVIPPSDLQPTLAAWKFPAEAEDWSTAWATLKHLPHAFCPVPEALPRMGLPAATIRWLWAKAPTVGFCCFLATLALLWRSRRLLAIYGALTAGLTLVWLFKYPGFIWHHGLVVMAFVSLAWIIVAAERAPRRTSKDADTVRLPTGPWRLRWLLPAVLSFQLVAGPLVVVKEIDREYSAGKRTAAFLEDEGWMRDDTLVAVFPCHMGAAILPYARDASKRFYYAEYDRMGSYTVWNRQTDSSEVLPIEVVAERILHAAKQRGARRTLLVLQHSPNNVRPELLDGRFRLQASFTGTQTDESFDLYELDAATVADLGPPIPHDIEDPDLPRTYVTSPRGLY